MPRFWDLIKTEKEKNFLRSFMPPGWDPDKPCRDIETLEEIERLVREKPKVKLAAIVAGKNEER